jgi:hypothetical protein
MAHHSGRTVNLTLRVDDGVLMLAKHRALLERTTVNQLLADALEDYADGAMEAARRSNRAVYVYGIVEEVRRMRRSERARRREESRIIRSQSGAESVPYPMRGDDVLPAPAPDGDVPPVSDL